MIVLREIIDKYERMEWDRWPQRPAGGRSLRIDDDRYRAGRREEILADIRLLQSEGLVRMKPGDWVEIDRDPARIPYRLEDMNRFYELAGIRPKWERLEEQTCELQTVMDQVESGWILAWLHAEQEKLKKGQLLKEEELPARRRLYRCLLGLNELERLAQEDPGQVPMLHRVFSKRFLGNSKTFEKEVKNSVISLARSWHPEIPRDKDEMDDVDVLEHLLIQTYSQELTVKGSLRFYPDGDGRGLSQTIRDTVDYPYGLVLNQQTLAHLTLCEEQSIRLVRTIENKANFVAEPYEEGKLVVFTHGYVTPMERKFLVKLREILDRQPYPVTYEHSGDMDYGGICIYRYLRERVFPGLTPYRMDVETYKRCDAEGMTEKITAEMAGKLRSLSGDPQLGELAARLAADGKVAEQEGYL